MQERMETVSIYSEIQIDHDTCDDCGHLLYEHIASVRSHETLAEYDGELHVALVKLSVAGADM